MVVTQKAKLRPESRLMYAQDELQVLNMEEMQGNGPIGASGCPGPPGGPPWGRGALEPEC